VYFFSHIVCMATAGRLGGDNAKPAPSCVLISDSFPVAAIGDLTKLAPTPLLLHSLPTLTLSTGKVVSCPRRLHLPRLPNLVSRSARSARLDDICSNQRAQSPAAMNPEPLGSAGSPLFECLEAPEGERATKPRLLRGAGSACSGRGELDTPRRI